MRRLIGAPAGPQCAAGAPTALPTTADALDNGVARTPPMGWNSWNTFSCDINESLIRQMGKYASNADFLEKIGQFQKDR